MLVLSSARVAMFAGSSPTDALADLSYYEPLSCPPLQTGIGADGVVAQRTTHFGTFQYFECAPGYTHTNQGKPLVCDPSSGRWQGLYNLATGRVCLPAGPGQPTINIVTPTSPTSARVSFSPPGALNGLTYYIVEANAGASFVERFTSTQGPADLTSWTWRDERRTSTFRFPDGTIRIEAGPSADCSAATPVNCPQYHRSWPSAAIPGSDWAIEAWVAFDSNMVQQQQFSGIGVFQDNSALGQNASLVLTAGLFHGAYTEWALQWGTLANRFTTLLSRPVYNAWIKIERTPPAAGAWDPLTNPTFFTASYRLSVRDSWVPLLGRLTDAQIVHTPLEGVVPVGLDPTKVRVGVLLRNANGGSRAAVLVDNLRISARSCLDPGAMRVVPSSELSAEVTGLTPGGAGYRFVVTGASPAVVGTPSNGFGPVTLPQPPAAAVVPLTGNIALNKPATISRRFTDVGQGPELGVDGIADATNWFQAATPGQGGCGDLGCWWQVDLGVQTDVRRVRVTNRWDQQITIDRAVGVEIIVSSTGGGLGYLNSIGSVCGIPDTLLRTLPYVADVPCVGTGRYITARTAPGNFLHLAEVEVFAANACPPRASSNAAQLNGANINCGNATYGTVCVQQCLAGFVPVGGAETAVCRGLSWDAAPLVCQPICPELAPVRPENTDKCTRTLIADAFSPGPTGSSNMTLSRWVSLDPGNQPIGQAWFAADGVVQGSARWGCRTEMYLVAGSQEIFDFQGTFTMTSMVNTRDRAGIVRALDKGNFLRLWVDVVEGKLVLDRASNGVVTTISDVSMPLTADTWYRLALRQSGAVVTVLFNDAAVLTTLDRTIVVGFVGLYAGSQAMFDDFSMITDCTSCVGAVPQDICKFTCRPGLLQTGNATRVCTLNATSNTAYWDGEVGGCTVPPPVFNGGVRAIAENSPRNAAVGDPLVAFLASPDETVSFSINSQTGPAAGLFWIDRCSGQLRVRSPLLLDYERFQVITLNVSAYVEGFPGAATNRIVTVNILNVNEAPVIVRGQVFNISEAAQLGEIIGTIRYTDPENTTARFSILPPSNGIVAVDNATAGTLAVAATTLLNFESGTTSFSLSVQAVDTWDATLSDTATVTLRVLDAPDAPTLRTSDVRILDSAAILGGVFSTPVNATLEDNGPPAGPFAGTAAYALVLFPQALAVCPSLVRDTEFATTTGDASSGAPLFAINPTTGFVSIVGTPAVPWSGRPARPVEGFARASYSLCVNVSATRFPGRAAVGVVRAIIVANLGSSPQITGYWVGNGTTGNRMDTVTPTQVWFTGLNLPVSGPINATYRNPSLGLSFVSSGCSVPNSTTMVCLSVPGVGIDLEWSIVAGTPAAPVASSALLLTSYYAPQVVSVSNHTGMPHEGGRWILVTGRYLGGLTTGGFARMAWGPTPTSLKYHCTLSWPASWTDPALRDRQAYCVAARGAGAGLVWALTVGGQVVSSDPSDTASQLSYIPPSITSVEVPDVAGGPNATGSRIDGAITSNLDTRGGTRLIIRGAGFGGDPSNIVNILYSTYATAEALTFTMVGCSRLVESDTTAVACFTPPGIGANLALKAEVEGQLSVQTLGNASLGRGVSYAPPQVRQLSGSFRGVSTAGGATFYVEGNFLGPDLPASPKWVRYGPLVEGVPTKYMAMECTVFVPHTVLSCTTAQGTGRGHFLQISVGTQASNVFNGSMSYGPPVVGGFEGAVVADTDGGQTVDIVGTNFGPIDPTTPVNVTYAAKLEPWFTQPSGAVLTYTPANCSVVIPHTRMRCTTAPGAGRDLNWFVTLDGLDSVEPTTSYAVPSVTSVVNWPAGTAVTAANVLGGSFVELRGDNFGPGPGAGNFAGLLVQELTYGPAGNERNLNMTRVQYVSHNAIRAQLPPGIGRNMTFRVTVAGQTSVPIAGARFSWFCGAQIYPRSLVRVLFGWDPNARTLDLDQYPRVNATWAGFRNPDGSYNVTVELPRDGAGSRVSVAIAIESVNTGTGASLPTIVTNARFFAYRPPTISNIVVVRTRFRAGAANVSAGESDITFPCPFLGGSSWASCSDALSTVVVYGANFGGPPAAITGDVSDVTGPYGVIGNVEVGTLATNTTPPVWSVGTANDDLMWLVRWDHTRIILLSKRSSGTLRVSLAAPNSTSSNDFRRATARFDNIAPEIKSVNLSPQASTAGGAILTLQVANIVNADFLRINIGSSDGYNCTLVDAGSSAFATEDAFRAWFRAQTSVLIDGDVSYTIYCRMPPGQGRLLPVVVTRLLSGASDPSDEGTLVSYAPPSLNSLTVDDGVPVTALTSASTVTVATNGSVVRVTGSNLGVAPTISLGDEFVLSGSDLRACPGLTAPTEFPHTCFEFTTPAGEGGGETLPPYVPGGFRWTLNAGNQPSLALRYRHAPPLVTSVVSDTGLFPTRGGVSITIRGANFGFTKETRDFLVFVNFRRSSDGSSQPCVGLARVDHNTITCQLPMGSGKNMEVQVIVAGTPSANSTSVGFSYDPPVFANVTAYAYAAYAGVDGAGAPILLPDVPRQAYNSTDPGFALYQANYTLPGGPGRKPQLRAGTTGNDTVLVIEGSNLGSQQASHCVCLTDVGRPAYVRGEFSFTELDECVCNDLEDYLGEGEVPASRILRWTHERIVLRPNEGVGLKEVRVSVRGSTLRLERGSAAWAENVWNLAYEPPRIESMTPATGPTDGGFVVELRGSNFGPRPGNFSTFDDQYASDFFTRDGWPQPLSVAPSLPIAFLRIRFHRGSVASSTTIRGEPALPDADPTKRIISWAHDRIVFEAPGGIGANRSAAVSVSLGRDTNRFEWSSAPFAFSYLPPTIAYANPNIVYMTDKAELRVKVLGTNFGDDRRAVEEQWTEEEKAVIMRFQNNKTGTSELCADQPARTFDDFLRFQADPAVSPITISCTLSQNTTVGFNSISVTAAGQTGLKPAALLVVCVAGFFGQPQRNDTCMACPKLGALCPGYLQSVSPPLRHTYPVPLPGWYNLNASEASACPGPASGVKPGSVPGGRDVCIVPCEPAESCLGDNFCADGYRSKAPFFRCASCNIGFYKRAGQCIKCPDSPYMLIIGFIALIGCAAGLGVFLQKKQVNIAVVSIGLDFFQVLAIFSQSKIKWPPAIKELLHVLSAFNLNLEIVAPECLIPDVKYVQKFMAVLLLPLAVGGLMAIMSFGMIMLKAAQGRKRNELLKHASGQVGMLLVLMYFLYLYETRTLLDTFNCAPTEPSDGKEYLQVVFEECGVPGGTQLTLVPWSLIGLAFYTVGYPAFVLYWVLYRNRFLIMEDQLLRAKGVGNDRLTNPHAFELRKTFSRSYFQFKPEYWYWFGAIILRKFCIAATSILFNRNSTFQMAACLLVMFCAYGLHLACRPYMSPSDYDEVLKDHTEKSFTSVLHARLRASIVSVESRGRKKVRRNLMTPDGKVDRSALLSVLGNWLFNYNTVESALLFAAVIVCLMGLMFDALTRGYASDYSARGQDSVTSVVLGVIIVSILYYVTVLVTEIYVLYTEEQRAAALKSAAGRKSNRKLDAGASGQRGAVGAPSAAMGNLAKGSIYDRVGGSRSSTGSGGAFNTGALDQSFNPMAIASARSDAGGLGLDAGSMSVVDDVGGMNAPPPPEVWRVVQATLKDMHQQLVEAKIREAELMAMQAAGGGDGAFERRTAFAPQATGADSAPSPGRGAGAAGPSAMSGLQSFRGNTPSVRR